MKPDLFLPKVQQYLQDNLHRDLAAFILAGSPFPEVSIQELAQQLDGLKRAKEKLPSWYKNASVYYPPKENIEQTSSELAAGYKAKLCTGKTLADLTGGLGIDSYYFSKQTEQVSYFERNDSLAEIAKHNFTALGAQNIQVNNTNSLVFLEKNAVFFDTIFLDPSRRDSAKGKVFLLKDCEPDVLQNLDLLLQKSGKLILKTSPLLDIQAGIADLKAVAEIHILAIKNEVKELIWVLRKNAEQEKIRLISVNISKNETKIVSCNDYTSGLQSESTYTEPQTYLYEPNAALMKSGLFHWISTHYQLQKLHPNTHLYTSHQLIKFPGRSFKIEAITEYSKKIISKKYKGSKANITKRNFKESVAQLRKKFKIRDGGTQYLFFTTIKNDKQCVLECSKIKSL